MAEAANTNAGAFQRGTQWLVDASGCRPSALRDEALLRALLDEVLATVPLRAAAPPLWKAFGGEAGVTGMVLLEESHLTVHTFPEHGYASIDLYCCVPRAAFDWQRVLARALGATHVRVRVLERAPELTADVSAGPPAPASDDASNAPSPVETHAHRTNTVTGGARSPARDREG